LEYPDVKFSSIINLPSGDFQKIIRDLSCISDKLEIKSVGNELIFTKEYEVQVRYTMYATFKVTAASEDDARSIAEEIGIESDPEFDMDGENTELDTWSIDDTRVDYIQEAR
jgi:hypothetical protein